MFSEDRKIEEIEKLHERNLEDQVISETSEDSKQAEVHVNSGVEGMESPDKTNKFKFLCLGIKMTVSIALFPFFFFFG